MSFIHNFLIVFLLLIALDFLWIGLIAKNFYKSQLSSWVTQFNVVPALFFYVLYSFMIIHFCFNSSYMLNGFLLGLMVYASYNLTNLATIQGWPICVVFVDTLWGSFMTFLTVLIAYGMIHYG